MASRDPQQERRWRAVLTQWHQSDQTISAFCQQRHLSKPAFGYWQRKLGFGRRTGPRSPAATFVPMSLVAEPTAEIVLLSGIVVRLPLSAAAESATRIIVAVEAASC